MSETFHHANDILHMKEALKQAERALHHDEVPIGAVITRITTTMVISNKVKAVKFHFWGI